MNRIDFLHTLYNNMLDLPEKVRREVLENYKEHFRISLEKGESEEQVSVRLGDPAQIAALVKKDPRTMSEVHKTSTSHTKPRIQGETINNGAGQQAQMPPNNAADESANQWQSYQTNGGTYYADYTTAQPFYRQPKGNGLIKGLGIMVLLFFMNLIFVLGPWLGIAGCLIGLWGASIGMTLGGIAGAAVCLLGPIIPGLGAFTGSISIATAIAGCAVVGSLGVLLTVLSLAITKWFLKLTGQYAGWNIQMIIGRRIA